MVLGVAFQVFGQLPDPACQQRDLDVCAAGVLSVQLELLDIQRFRILSHFEAPILDQDDGIARALLELKRNRQPVGRNPFVACCLRSDELARVMRFHRPALCPMFDDQIDPPPKWKIHIGRAGDVFEQPHPKRRQRFVIKIADAVVRGESADLFAHSFQCLLRGK